MLSFKTILRYLKQKTTITGLLSFITAITGIVIAPELAAEISTAVVAIASGALILLDEDKVNKD